MTDQFFVLLFVSFVIGSIITISTCHNFDIFIAWFLVIILFSGYVGYKKFYPEVLIATKYLSENGEGMYQAYISKLPLDSAKDWLEETKAQSYGECEELVVKQMNEGKITSKDKIYITVRQ